MDKNYLKEIGIRLKEVRKALNLTQDEIHKKTGLSIGFISEIENGKKRPSSILLFFFAKNYNANINYVLTGKGDKILSEGYSEKSSNSEFGKDRELIEELLYYLKNVNVVKYNILLSFVRLKSECPYLFKKESETPTQEESGSTNADKVEEKVSFLSKLFKGIIKKRTASAAEEGAARHL